MKYNNRNRLAQSKENKNKIIASAKKLIEEKGFDKITVQDIVDQAGVAKGSFYIHFKSKEDVVQEIMNMSFDQFKTKEEGLDSFQQISEFLSKSIRYIVDSGKKTAQKWFSEAVMASIAGQYKLEYDLKTIKSILRKEYNDFICEQLSQRIVSMYYGILTLWCIKDGNFNTYEAIELYLNNEVKKILNRGE